MKENKVGLNKEMYLIRQELNIMIEKKDNYKDILKVSKELDKIIDICMEEQINRRID